MFRSLIVLLLCAAVTAGAHAANRASAAPRPGAPERAIILLIDGLHADALERGHMPNLEKLAAGGALIRRVSLIAPDHPHQGPYARVHTTAIPNVSLLAGNFFIPVGCRLAQDSFYDPMRSLTAHGVNEYSYQSINRNFCISNMDPGLKDGELLDWAARTQREKNIRFMLLHLQNVGEAGMRCAHRGEAGWNRNIWGEGSPYLAQLTVTDAAVGKFVADLKAAGTWDKTLLIVSADHGQAPQGSHPAISPDAWRTLAIVTGPGIKKGFTAPQCDQIDLVPTLCAVMGVEPPNPGQGCGLVLNEIRTGRPDTPTRLESWSETYNEQERQYLDLLARAAALALKDPAAGWGTLTSLQNGFYTIQQVLVWNEQKTVKQFLENNRRALEGARRRLENPDAPDRRSGPPPQGRP